eukprot:584031-Pleurochrysis_carterae.AAC.1
MYCQLHDRGRVAPDARVRRTDRPASELATRNGCHFFAHLDVHFGHERKSQDLPIASASFSISCLLLVALA